VESSNKIWYYTQIGVQTGPAAADQLVAMAQSGQLLPADLVWKEGMDSWVDAGTARWLFPMPAAAATPTPMPPPISPTQVVEPPQSATQAGASPVNDAIWYYENGGTRVGPVSEAQMATLLISGALTATSQVWKKGLAGWTKLGDTELSTKISASERPPALASVSEEPPALAGGPVNNTLVWIVAFMPLISALVAVYVALRYNVTQMSILIATGAAYITLCVVDGVLLRKAGHDTFTYMFWGVIVPPVYLYKRAKNLLQSKSYFVCWLITTAVSVALSVALSAPPIAVWLSEVQAKTNVVAAGTPIVTSLAPSPNLPAPPTVPAPFKAKALAYARGVAQQDSCDLNEQGLVAISGKLSGIDGEIVVAAYTLEGCGGGNFWGQHLVVLDVSNGTARKLAITAGPLFEELRIADGRLSADVTSYAPDDARCCPSLKANKSFSISGQTLVTND